MKKLYNFILRSSADPRQTSATIKFALLGIIPYIMQALDLVCSFGSQCYDLDPSLFETIVSALADGTFYLLSLVSICGTIWAAGRKFYRTVTGQNRALVE